MNLPKRRMTATEREIAKVAAYAQHNHHTQKVSGFMGQAELHRGRHWQGCPSLSCLLVWQGLAAFGYFSDAQIVSHLRSLARWGL